MCCFLRSDAEETSGRFFFFFQAEDGIRDIGVTGVQTCALPILPLTPVRTGTLRRSETNRVETGGLKGWIGSNVVYAPFVHANVPFFQMGIEQSAPERDQLLQDAGDAYLRGL